jgi:cell pole-organizing protein PopZ
MAERALKEPTMEEILSSIRRIIADGEAPGAGLPETANQDGPAGDADVDYADLHSDVFPELAEAEPASETGAEPDFMVFSELPDLEADLDLREDVSSEPVELGAPFEPVSLEPSRKEEPNTVVEPLADAQTVDAAAGYLARLLSEINFDQKIESDPSINTLVRELLRPMMKEWLDAYLPGIVEKQVEAEVQRIARMAR